MGRCEKKQGKKGTFHCNGEKILIWKKGGGGKDYIFWGNKHPCTKSNTS